MGGDDLNVSGTEIIVSVRQVEIIVVLSVHPENHFEEIKCVCCYHDVKQPPEEKVRLSN